jgi:DNA-binding transcriptional MocR family regulator
MPPLTALTAADLAALHDDVHRRYDAFAARRLGLDLTRGKPSNAQLDLAAPLLALPGPTDHLAADGSDVRNYGGLQGLAELRAVLGPLVGAPPAQVVLGDNSSLALMHDAVAFALLHGVVGGERPWGREPRVAFLCPVPGYDRHFTICEALGIEMIPVPLTEAGPDLAAVEPLVAANAAIKGMWCVPKYSNPTGTVYSAGTVERLAAMPAAAADFRLFWDDAYAVHHLTDERIAIANVLDACARHGHPHRPFVFGSTSKITLAGAGVALFAGSPDNVAWYLKAMTPRTIGGDKVNQLRHVRFLRDTDGVLALMQRHRAIVAPKFAAVLDAFDRHLAGSGVAAWTRPKGGYFISLDVADGLAAEVVRLAAAAGVALTPAGATFPLRNDPRDRNIRVAPTYPDLDAVAAAAEGVALSVLAAATRALRAGRPATVR